MKPQRKKILFISIFKFFIFIILILALPLSLYGYDTRIFALDGPTLSHTFGAALAGVIVIFPTDEFLGLGLSAVEDTLDIWKLPSRLADKELFPTNSVIIDYTGGFTGNGGLVIAPSRWPVTLGIFTLRPNQNGWVIGEPRGDLAGLGATYFADSGNDISGTPPAAPSNIIDALCALKVGSILIGGGIGYAYDKAFDAENSIAGTADSTTTQKSKSSVLTFRAGVTFDLVIQIPITFDIGVIFAHSNYEATLESGAAAVPLVSQDDSITADNNAFSIGTRIIGGITSDIEVVVLGEYTRLPQDYSQTDDGTALDSTTDQVDDTKFTSFGGGAGINWTPSDKVLVNTLVTVVFGEGEWVAEAPGAGNRPGDTLDWVTLRGVIDGEFTIARWLLLRGGLGAGLSWAAEKQGVDTGLVESEDKSFTFFPSAAAGLGIKIKDPVSLDFVLNLNNFATGAPFGALSTRASIKVDF
jgi:hypothetical protein